MFISPHDNGMIVFVVVVVVVSEMIFETWRV